jgi:ABC-2 type transport system ATP-binding protein
LLQPSSGSIAIAGRDRAAKADRDRRQLQQLLGFVPDTPPIHDYLTGRQYVDLVASLWSVPRQERDARAAPLLSTLGLDDKADELAKSYSHGTRKKLHLAAVLTTRPAVLLLDEPTSGLDPLSVRRLKDLLLAEAARGTTVMLSTHGLELAEQICHRVGILAGGRLRAEGTVQALRAAADQASLEDVFLRATGAGG